MTHRMTLWGYLGRGLRLLALTAALLVALVPLLYLALNSIKLPREFLTVPPTILPSQPTLEHFQRAFADERTARVFRNTLTVTGTTTVVSVILGSLAAYGLTRLKVAAPFAQLAVFVFLFIRFYPRVTTVIPFFLLMRQVGLGGTVWAITLGHLGITVPFVTWLMMIVFNDMPREIEEAAIVDGTNPWQSFRHVVLPISVPGLASAAILTAFLSWNEFLIAASIARQQSSVLSLEVAGFVTDKGILWGPMSAMSVVMVAPMLLFALFMQRYLIRGLMLGAVKG